jgi:4-diphosphocytidyl-2-C-methyl-D-erythritol kinase
MTPDSRAWPAPAKLNLLLEITGRRDDGYHLLQTVFQLLDWGDSLDFSVTRQAAIERVTGLPGVAPEADLAVRAARLLQDHCGVRQGARLWLHKHIPMGAGLGGASSNAATTLVALNRLWGCALGVDELAGLGLQLGADVPVFVRGHSAWAEGVGERLQPLALGERHYVLLLTGFHAATASLFAEARLKRDCAAREAHVPPHRLALPNVFEPLLRQRFPQLQAWLDELPEGLVPRMTGTGSSYFFAVEDHSQAIELTTRLKSLYNGAAVDARAVRGVDQSALYERLQAGIEQHE